MFTVKNFIVTFFYSKYIIINSLYQIYYNICICHKFICYKFTGAYLFIIYLFLLLQLKFYIYKSVIILIILNTIIFLYIIFSLKINIMIFISLYPIFLNKYYDIYFLTSYFLKKIVIR